MGRAMLKVSRFSVFEPENCVGIQGNCAVMFNGAQVRDVRVADTVRGMVKVMVRGADGEILIDRVAKEVVTTDLKGHVELRILDPYAYISAQAARLDELRKGLAAPS